MNFKTNYYVGENTKRSTLTPDSLHYLAKSPY